MADHHAAICNEARPLEQQIAGVLRFTILYDEPVGLLGHARRGGRTPMRAATSGGTA